MLTDLLLSSSPWQPPGRGRRCALWVSPWIDRTTILDTAALTPGDLRHAGPDQFPADCLLLVVSPAEHARLTQLARSLPYPVGGPPIAAAHIDLACRQDPALRRALRW
jgi:hypothetical protein